MKKIQFNIAEKIVSLLKQNNANLCSAESCTGGGIAKALTDVPGCSEVFAGGIIAYSNEIKTRLLYVTNETIEKFGAVSEETVKSLAIGAAKVFNTHFCIATTGIAGPSGGTIDKPVGTVWIGITTPDNVMALKYHFKGNRENIREKTITNGLKFLTNEIQNYIENN